MIHREIRVGRLVLGLLLAVGCSDPLPTAHVSRATQAPVTTLIRNVAVLEVSTGARFRGRDVLLRDGRIAEIRPSIAELPAGVTVIDGPTRVLLVFRQMSVIRTPGVRPSSTINATAVTASLVSGFRRWPVYQLICSSWAVKLR